MTENSLVSKWSRPSTLANGARLVADAPSVAGPGGRLSYRGIRSRIASIVKSTIRNRNLFAVDLALSAFALMLAAWLRFGPQMFMSDPGAAKSLAVLMVVFVAICAVTFPVAGLYKRKWKYASILDYIVLVQSDPHRIADPHDVRFPSLPLHDHPPLDRRDRDHGPHIPAGGRAAGLPPGGSQNVSCQTAERTSD